MMRIFARMQLVLSLLVFTMSLTAFAGEWKISQQNGKWWYLNDDGTYAKDGWHWIDGNNDGIAECYYFDSDGYLYVNTTTPDGYLVDSNGAWTINGVIQTKNIGTTNTNVQTQTNSNEDSKKLLYVVEKHLERNKSNNTGTITATIRNNTEVTTIKYLEYTVFLLDDNKNIIDSHTFPWSGIFLPQSQIEVENILSVPKKAKTYNVLVTDVGF